jgi:hypothetical protein
MQSLTRSGLFRISLLCGLVAALPIAASAAKIVMCSTCDPTPIILTQTNGALNDLQPDGAQTVTDEFVNETGTLLDDIVYTTTINKGLDPTMLANDGDFTCDAPNGFYLNCAVGYDPISGVLTYDYFGVNPPDWQDLPVVVIFEDLIGGGFGDTGIPNLGVFEIQLQGWTDSLTDNTDPSNPVQLYNGRPTLGGAFNVPVPEASAALILLTELLLLAGVLALFGRRLKWNRHFDL